MSRFITPLVRRWAGWRQVHHPPRGGRAGRRGGAGGEAEAEWITSPQPSQGERDRCAGFHHPFLRGVQCGVLIYPFPLRCGDS